MLWLNEISGDLSLRWLSDEYPIFHSNTGSEIEQGCNKCKWHDYPVRLELFQIHFSQATAIELIQDPYRIKNTLISKEKARLFFSLLNKLSICTCLRTSLIHHDHPFKHTALLVPCEEHSAVNTKDPIMHRSPVADGWPSQRASNSFPFHGVITVELLWITIFPTQSITSLNNV